ncbi:MAG: hypothetical protein ACTHMI_04350 [Mucilaginibacter sp.]
MKNLTLLLLLITAFTAKAQTAQQDSAHRAYHLMHKKDPCAGARVPRVA